MSGFVAFVLLLEAVEGTESFILHGGGIANINCLDGSTVQGQVEFSAVQNGNKSISGNWTLDSSGSPGLSSASLSEGFFYGGNFSESDLFLKGR